MSAWATSRRPPLLGTVMLAMLVLVATPVALAAGFGLMWVMLASSLVGVYGLLVPSL